VRLCGTIHGDGSVLNIVHLENLKMPRAGRVVAFIGVMALAAGGTMLAQEAPKPEAPQSLADMVDASRLPRMAGSQELFASKLTTSFVVRESVAEATEATRALLAADGWQPHRARISANALPDKLTIMNFRKGTQGLNVFITVAPAQGGATSIQYTPIAIETNPFSPKDAVRIADGRPEPTAPPQAAQEAPARQEHSDPGLVDMKDVPRLEGAQEREGGSSHRARYVVSGTRPTTIAAVRKLVGEAGWVSYVVPLERPDDTGLMLKKGPQGMIVSTFMDGGSASRSAVQMTANRLYNNIPFPAGASEIVFDDSRPYLRAVAPGTAESLLAFFRRELTAAGWSAWSAADAARFPNAAIEENVDNGLRAYFTRDKRDRQPPIQVTLQRRADGRLDIEVKVPPFARLQDLAAGQDTYGLPKPERIKSATGRDGRTQRELTATVPAELDTVLKFYRRELAKRNWQEEAHGAVVEPDRVVLNFSSPDSRAMLTLGYQYDLTTVSLVQQLPDAVVAARAKARQEAEDKLQRQAEEWLRGPPVVLAATTAPTNSPIPVPETAENPNFDSGRGDLKFKSRSSVREIAAFYRSALEPLGFKEVPTVIDGDSLVELNFSRQGKRIFVTIHRLGSLTDVRSYGPALVALAGEQPVLQALRSAARPAQEAFEELEADDTDGLPVPKKHILSISGKSNFQNDREATVPASLESVLAFYRRELAKLGWKEETKGAIINAQRVALSFTTPDGPGTLMLGRADGKTTIRLSQRKPAEAAKHRVIAKPGMGLILIGSAVETEATVTIDRKTIKVAPGVGQKNTDGPRLDLRPGTYKASVKIAGQPAFSEEVKVGAGQTWGLLIGPGGILPLQVY
jgi:hypothetical protein